MDRMNPQEAADALTGKKKEQIDEYTILPSSDPNKIARTYYLPEDLIEDLERLARKAGISKTDVVIKALQIFISKAKVK